MLTQLSQDYYLAFDSFDARISCLEGTGGENWAFRVWTRNGALYAAVIRRIHWRGREVATLHLI